MVGEDADVVTLSLGVTRLDRIGNEGWVTGTTGVGVSRTPDVFSFRLVQPLDCYG